MRQHAITILCVLAAGIFYAVGFGFGIEVALIVGFVVEMVFWVWVSTSLTQPRGAPKVFDQK